MDGFSLMTSPPKNVELLHAQAGVWMEQQKNTQPSPVITRDETGDPQEIYGHVTM